jgi:hypothetical protein
MLKSITLHRPTVDNVDGFHDAGADLVIGDERKAGVIDADRARELVGSHGAAGHHAAASKTKAPAKPRTPKKKPAVATDTPVGQQAATEPKEPELPPVDSNTAD